MTKIFDKSPGIGLDIGSQKIKVAQVRNSPSGLKVIGFDSMDTPPGTVEAGNIVDPVGLGAELKKMVTKLKLKHRRVVSAVAGQQVYTRNIVMPHMKLEELKQATSFQAINFLPIPVEEAAIDIFPLRDFENEEGQHTEVFFVAARRRQVENLDMVCNIAGLNLAAVEIEPLAVNRVLGRNNPEEVGAYLNIGSSSSFFSVFKENMPVFYRSMSCGCSAFYAAMEMKAAANSGKTEEIQFGQSSQYDYLTRDIIGEVTRSVEYYNLQQGGSDQGIEKVWLCGGGARFKGLDANLAAGSGLEIVAADLLSSLIIPDRLSPEQGENLQYEYLIALGLAARM
ncbi:MAG TPA: type IV pilus assembly protein PilM [Syntrophomonas sp.]|nr:type IV pilus assembly protein PilM [Syntrophomonas sp.]